MLDNMSPEEMKEAIGIIDGRAETECSGNVTRENIEQVTERGRGLYFQWSADPLRTDHGYFHEKSSSGGR